MRRIDDVMKELGFKENSSEDVQRAFIKNLIHQAYGVEILDEPRAVKPEIPVTAGPKTTAQLEFNFENENEAPAKKQA